MLRETKQNTIQQTAYFACVNHVDIELIEDFWMLLQRVGKGRTSLNIELDFSHRLTEKLVFRLGRKDIETLNKGQAGIDHGRKLTRKDDKVLVFDSSAA